MQTVSVFQPSSSNETDYESPMQPFFAPPLATKRIRPGVSKWNFDAACG